MFFLAIIISVKKGGVSRSPRHTSVLGGWVPPCLGGRQYPRQWRRKGHHMEVTGGGGAALGGVGRRHGLREREMERSRRREHGLRGMWERERNRQRWVRIETLREYCGRGRRTSGSRREGGRVSPFHNH
jgi:nuclear pore complex protein Nup205